MPWKRKVLNAEDVTIKQIATDRHTLISSAMNKDHKDIQHQFDIWHLSKWVVKQLSKKAKVKGCENLFPWIKDSLATTMQHAHQPRFRMIRNLHFPVACRSLVKNLAEPEPSLRFINS